MRNSKRFGKIIICVALAGVCFMPSNLKADEIKQNEKEETVYEFTDAEGKIDKTIVSVWLKNNTQEKSLQDVSSLKNIENIKGKETFKQKGNAITWNAKGKDIYYQGDAGKEIPLKVKVTYTLNDKEISAKDIKGKSGRVSIHVSYENELTLENTKNQVPMFMISGMILDDEVFSNVEIDNGKVIQDGSRNIVVGYGISGLNESLSLKEEIIPTSFTIRANVKKFKTSEMMTFASNSFLKELDLHNINSIDGLKGSLQSLSDASNKLIQGSTSLSEGMALLTNKSSALANGIYALNEGTKKLDSGLSSLSPALVEMRSGAKKLEAGLMQVLDGITQAMNARAQLYNGAEAISNGMDEAGKALSTSIQYNQKTDQYLKGIQNALTNENLTPEQKELLNQVLQPEVLNQIVQANTGSMMYQQGVLNQLTNVAAEGTLKNGIAKMMAALGTGENSLGYGLQKMQMAFIATQQQNGTSGLIEGMQILEAGMDEIIKGTQQLKTGSSQLYAGTSQLDMQVPSLISGIQELNAGAKALRDGIVEFDEKGIDKLVQAFNGDIQSLVKQLQNIVETGAKYQSYSGKEDNMKGNVKFIIKTSGIE